MRVSIFWKYAGLVTLLLLTLTGCSNKIEEVPKEFDFKYQVYTSHEDLNIEKSFANKKEVPDGNLGFYKGVLWTEVEVQNKTSEKISLIVASTDKLNHSYLLFTQDTLHHNLILYSSLGEEDYKDGRSFDYSNPNFQIELKPFAKQTYFLYGTSDGRIVESTPTVLPLQKYLESKNVESRINIFYYSILFFIFLINILFWTLFKKKIHAFYSTYVLSSVILYLWSDGYLYGLNINHSFVDHIVFVCLRLIMFSFVIFTALFLKITISSPKLYGFLFRFWISYIVLATCYQLLFFNISISYLHLFDSYFTFLWILSILIMLIISVKRHKKNTKLYLVALVFQLLFMVLGLISSYTPLINLLGLQTNSFYKIGTFLEILIFTYTTILILRNDNKNYQALSHSYQIENEGLKLNLHDNKSQKLQFLSLIKLVELNLTKEADWIEFKEKVKEVEPDFIQKLEAINSDLTKNDLRILLLTKVGFTQKEMSDLLYIEEGSIKKAKQRVRRKLNLGKEITLAEYVSNLTLKDNQYQ